MARQSFPATRQLPLIPRPMSPAAPPGPGSCVMIGKNRPWLGTRRFRVCLTDNARRRLFGKDPPRKLGCGSFGCAFTTDSRPDRVVKLTQDQSDVASMEIVSDARIPHTLKLFDGFTLTNPGVAPDGEKRTFYAIVTERVHRIPRPWMRTVSNVLAAVRYNDPDDAARACARIQRKGDVARCREFAGEVFEMQSRLSRIGVDWTDVHENNVGIASDGEWKIIDIGMTDNRPRRARPLDGHRTRKGRRSAR